MHKVAEVSAFSLPLEKKKTVKFNFCVQMVKTNLWEKICKSWKQNKNQEKKI